HNHRCKLLERAVAAARRCYVHLWLWAPAFAGATSNMRRHRPANHSNAITPPDCSLLGVVAPQTPAPVGGIAWPVECYRGCADPASGVSLAPTTSRSNRCDRCAQDTPRFCSSVWNLSTNASSLFESSRVLYGRAMSIS